MAWTYTKTDWSDGNRFTPGDMNRINGNINALYPDADLPENETQNGFWTVAEFSAIEQALAALIATSGLNASVPGYAGTSDTINEIEDLTQRLHDRIALNLAQAPATIYAGDDLFASQSGQYPDVTENYSRGV